jgi:glycosyltransferase involved in cell wall biosynthesis
VTKHANNFTDDDVQAQVVCAQIGARDHYAFPRALQRRGALAALVTDFWWPGGGAGALPLIGRMRGRSHPDLLDARVLSMNVATLASEAVSRFTQRHHWERMMHRNEWFQVRALRCIPWQEMTVLQFSAPRPVLFAYSYAALGLLRRAKDLGWTTVLGQTDPGPLDTRITAEQARQWPEFGASPQLPPRAYYDQWRQELALADRILVNSEWTRQALLTEGVAAERMATVPLPCEAHGTREHPAKDYPAAFHFARPLRVLFLGQINLRKGVPALLTAMQNLTNTPVELWMAGPPKLEVPARHATASNIRWLGPFPRGDVGRLYQDADVFIFPTHSDGFGLTQLEAQSWRMPVIASRQCGEVVVDQQNGMVLDEVTTQCIQAALSDCCANPQRLRQWSIHSGIAPSFRLDACGEALMQVIHDARS